jgi:hypothetical protein
MSTSRLVGMVLAMVLSFLGMIGMTAAQNVDLAVVLPNSGFENGFSGWVKTIKNKNYIPALTVVNPTIVPKEETDPLIAPSGDNFVGIDSPKGKYINGSLQHVAVKWFFPRGTAFEIRVWGNRGRTACSQSASFPPTEPTELNVRLL